MGENIKQLAQNSPGLATAALQSGATQEEMSQLNALLALRQTHNKLTSLPQNEAYKNFKALPTTEQDALKQLFSPKYVEEDKGFFGNILRSAKNATYYGGGTTWDLVKTVLNFGGPIAASRTLAKTGLAAGESVVTSEQLKPVTSPIGKVAEAVVQPQEKLVKQPYIAARLAQEGEDLNFLETVGQLGKYVAEGAKELVPGTRDAKVTDNSTGFKKYWEFASDRNNVYDLTEVSSFEKDLTPEVAYVSKLLASKKDLVGEFDQYKNNPQVLDLIARYTSGDKQAMSEIAYAVSRYESAKVSPGRDIARALTELFPHEAEKAIKGDSNWNNFFKGVSGGVDLGVTFGLDPLILLGKAKRAVDTARFGLIKIGVNPSRLEDAWQYDSVKNYFNEVTSLVKKYDEGDIVQKGEALTRIKDRFKEISTNVFEDLVKAKVYTSEDALKYFKDNDLISAMAQGSVGVSRNPLIPRYTVLRTVSDKLKDAFASVAKTNEFTNVPTTAKTVEDFTDMLSKNPIVWADKLGVEKMAGGKLKELIYTPRDKSFAARTDKFVRALSVAPSYIRAISIADASSADEIFKLARAAGVSKTGASTYRSVWINADEGQRLAMFKGVLKTIAIGLGLDHSEAGRKIISSIDEMSTELYSVNQTTINLGELTDKLKFPFTAGAKPQGVRKAVQEKVDQATADQKATRVYASLNSEIADLSSQLKALRDSRKVAAKANITSIVESIDNQIKIVGGRLNSVRNEAKQLGLKIKGKTQEKFEFVSTDFNAAETVDGVQRAVRMYQLNNYRSLPNLAEWRAEANRAGIASSLIGRISNDFTSQRVTDVWSFGNLYPRLGIRTTTEELGTYFLISGTEGFGNYIKGRLVSRELRAAQPKEFGIKIKTSRAKTLREKEISNLGVLYDTLFKITRQHYSKKELLDMADNPEQLGNAVANAIVRGRFKFKFIKSVERDNLSEFAKDFSRFEGKKVLNEINGAATNAERIVSENEVAAKTLSQYGPSIALNVNLQEAVKGMQFKKEATEILASNPKFLTHWHLELNNVVGKRNGKFGNIVLWNMGQKPGVVIDKLQEYIEGPGLIYAKRFAHFASEGSRKFAERIYADVTYPFRDYAGRINMKLVNAIRNKGGIENFSIDELAAFDKKFQTPAKVLGNELIPLGASNGNDLIGRIINNGYGWVGKQIALLDREPILLGNYYMYRNDLLKNGYQKMIESNLVNIGMKPSVAEESARLQSHDIALNLARQRTLSYVDNSDVRTNLAFSLKTLGRYYRATEDFYRRIMRLTKYEKRALVRLAIINQSFAHSGFIHQDDKGDLYFTYPGDDLVSSMVDNTFFRIFGINTSRPLPVNFGGKVKMLTPSLDPQSAPPRLGGPLTSVPFEIFGKLPFIGNFVKESEKVITGTYNPYAPLWKKILPTPVTRLVDAFISGPDSSEQKFSASVQAMRLLISTGNGPTDPSQITEFLNNAEIQATNVLLNRLWQGQLAPASIQMYANKDVPKEMINAGVFNYSSEFQKFLRKYEGDAQMYDKALVDFAKIYPSKLVYTVSSTTAGTEASFRKTFQAAEFINKNQSLFEKHKEGAAFFVPLSGTNDYESYVFLKSQNFIQNKTLEDFLKQAATANARQEYFKVVDEYNTKISAATGPLEKRNLRDELSKTKALYKSIYPLLAVTLQPGNNAPKEAALNDLRNVIKQNLSPNKDLAVTFSAMIDLYDVAQNQLKLYPGNRDIDTFNKKNIRQDLKEELLKAAGENPNARSLYWNIFEPLIGD